jgi:hypothetical protein
MLTVCWAAKGGSGTTVTAAAMALSQRVATLLVDLAGDVPLAIGAGDDLRPGVSDWLVSDATPERLSRLEQIITTELSMIPAGRARGEPSSERWQALADRLAGDSRPVVVDAGTGEPPTALLDRASGAYLVTRPCYIALTRACAQAVRPTGVILVTEPGRALRRDDVERSIGSPIVATVLIDPKIARAVDAGLATSRLPRACLDQLRAAT